MLVLHVAWLPGTDGTDGELGVWAEDSTAVPPARRPGRPPRVRPHPFAAGPDTLAALGSGRGAAGTATLSMPTLAAAPVASPQLVRDDVSSGAARPRLADWSVPCLRLRPAHAVALLTRPAAVDLVPGASVRHLAAVAGFAAELVARGRVLPAVVEPGPRAVWRPVVTGADAAWARALAAALPPSLVAAAPADPSGGWADLLDGLVDAAARPPIVERWVGRRAVDAVARRWFAALGDGDGRFDATPDEAAALRVALATWQRDAAVGPVRALFRLTEPPPEGVLDGGPGEPTWAVQLALQDVEQPSLVAEAEAVWRARGVLPAFGGRLTSPQETFLAELGKASRIYPELDDALAVARPATLSLDTEGAHRFLRTAAPALATAGFGVQLPGWWNRPSARLGMRLTASTPSQPGQVAAGRSVVGTDAIAAFRHDLVVDGQVLTADELAELAAAKAPMVRLRGQWIELDARRLAAGMKLVGQTQSATIGELIRLGLGGSLGGEELPVESIVADGWLGDLLSGGAEQRMQPVPVPAGFTGALRPYQQRGLAWLDFLRRAGLGGVLADDMGLGKTVQLLALTAHDVAESPGAGPSLLICPMSLVGNWQREAARFTPALRVHVHHGAERARGAAFAATVADSDLVVTTYAVAARDAAELRKTQWRRVVVDEAQAIKNAATKQATAIRSVPAAARIAVTGTPVENRLADLWSILEFVNPGLLGSAASFRSRYAEPIERRGDAGAAERLRRFTGPFVLRRLKTDKSVISDLPEKLEIDVLCNLSAEQAALYRAVVDDMLERIETTEGIERRGLVLATMTKLKQVCNHPSHFLRDGGALSGRSGKLERVDEIVDEVLAGDEKVLLFTQYAEFGAMLRGHLSGRTGREVLFLHGGLGKPARDAMVARFQDAAPGSPSVFVLSLKAGGTGLTLTAANHVVHVDRWWNPAVEDQATDRAFRIGQRRNVQVRKLVCAGTVEEKIAAMIADKRGLAARIVGTGEGWLTELSTGALRDLFTLEAGAVVE